MLFDAAWNNGVEPETLFDNFLKSKVSQRTIKKPLQVSDHINRPIFSQKVHNTALRVVDSYFSSREKTPISQKRTVSKALACLRSSINRKDHQLYLLKNSQRFIIDLIDISEIYFAFNELKELKKAFCNTLGVGLNEDGSIPFVEISTDLEPSLLNLVVSYHFLYLQCLLLGCSKYSKSIFLETCSFITIAHVFSVPSFFLKNSSFGRWLASLHSVKPQSEQKTLQNMSKLIAGFCRLPVNCKTSMHGNQLQHTLSCLQLKSIELKVKLNSPENDKIPSLDSSLEPYILELRNVLVEHNRTDLLTQIDNAIQVLGQMEKSCAPSLEALSLMYGEDIESTNLSAPISLERLQRLIKDSDHSLIELYVLEIIPHVTEKDLPVMDRVTVYLKDNIANSSCNIQFFETCISRMFSVFKKQRQWKRIRNISNLLVNLGNRKEALSLSYWKESIALEVLILEEQTDINRYEEQVSLRLKCERIIDNLVKRGQYQLTVHFFGQLFNNLHFKGLENLLEVFSMPEVMSCLGTVLSKDLSTCYELFRGLSEQRAALVIVNLLRYSGTRWNTSTLSSIMQHSAVESTFFKFLCEYEILKCFPKVAIVQPHGSVATNLEALLLCGIDVHHDPFRAVSQFESYLSSSKPPFEIWLEQDIVWNLVVNLQLSNLHKQAVDVITLYLSARAFMKDSQDINNMKWLLSLNLKLCSSHLACNNLALLHQSLFTCASLLKQIAAVDSSQVRSYDVLIWKLLQLELEHKTDLASATKRHAAVKSFIQSKKEFTLDDPHSSFPNKLLNLFALAKAHLISGDLELSLGRHGAAYDAFRLAVKLLLSISKRLDSLQSTSYSSFSTEVSELLCLALIRGIKVQRTLGLSRESEAFVEELQSVTSMIHSRGRIILNLKEIVIFKALQCDLKGFKDALHFFLELFDDTNYKSFFNDIYYGCLHLAMSTKQFEFDSSEVSHHKPTLEVAFLSNLLADVESSWKSNSQDRESLSLLLKSRLRLSSAIRSLQMIPLYSMFHNTVSSLPSFNKLELVFKNQLSGIRGHETTRAELVDQLVLLSDELFNQSAVMESLAPYELHYLHSLLSGALLALNSVSQVHDSSKTKLSQILQQLFYLQDVLRAKTIIGERLSHLFKAQKGDSIIPSSIELQQFSQELLLQKSDSFFNRVKTNLPSDWTIVTIDRCPNSDSLLLTRLTHLGSPFVVRLPLLRMKQRGKNTVSIDQVFSKLQAIVEASNKSTQVTTTSQIKTKDDRKKWWSARFGLDLQFESLLDLVRKTWIGGFSGLFGAAIDVKTIELFREDFVKAWQEILPKRLARVSNTFSFLDDQVLRLFLTISDIHSPFSDYEMLDDAKESLSDLIYFLLDSLSLAGETISYTEINMEKSVQILASVISKFKSMHSWNHGHTVIVPAKEFEMFPWESLLPLKGVSVSRVLSVEMLLELLEKRNETSTRVKKDLGLAYLLNPGGDLGRTEANFSTFFQRCSSWNGITGRNPGTGFFEDNVIGKDLYVYLGHGGCEQYISMNDLMRASASGFDIPPSLLIGCSSASLTRMGFLESYGNIYSWLAAGSPMVLVNLWDVTDKDIDKFSMSVFEYWGLSDGENNLNLCQAVSRSREKCTLRHLNGSSPVVYGLPLRVDQL